MLDILLFYENDDSLLLFRRLCKYYFSINPMVTAQYITYYREQNDPEGIKFGNKVEIKVKEEETNKKRYIVLLNGEKEDTQKA